MRRQMAKLHVGLIRTGLVQSSLIADRSAVSRVMQLLQTPAPAVTRPFLHHLFPDRIQQELREFILGALVLL